MVKVGRPKDIERSRRVVALYRQGLSIREVAAKEGCTFQRVHQIICRDAPQLMRSLGRGMSLSPSDRLARQGLANTRHN